MLIYKQILKYLSIGSKKMLLIECYLERYIIKLTVIISTYDIQHYLVTIFGNTHNVKISKIPKYKQFWFKYSLIWLGFFSSMYTYKFNFVILMHFNRKNYQIVQINILVYNK